MFVPWEVVTEESFEATLTAQEKQQRREQIDALVKRVAVMQTEFINESEVNIAHIRKLVTKSYDAILRKKIKGMIN